MRDCLYLVDGGFAINSPFPLSLQPQRAVDLILSFDYSLDAPFEVKCRAGGGWVFATAAWLGVERSPFKEGLGSELWVSTFVNTVSSSGLPIWKVMGKSENQERRPKRVLGSLYPGKEETAALAHAVSDGFPAPVWAWVLVCCPLVTMVTTEPAGPPPGSLGQRLPPAVWGFGGRICLCCLSHLAGGRQSWRRSLGLCESRGPQGGSEVHKSASLLRSYR